MNEVFLRGSGEEVHAMAVLTIPTGTTPERKFDGFVYECEDGRFIFYPKIHFVKS
jgi:hypothetical protein